MVRPGRDRLSGEIEVDEAYVGGKHVGKRGRGAFGKQIVFVSVEKKAEAMGRIRLVCIPDVSCVTLRSAILETIEDNATIYSDGWSGYAGLSKSGYTHKIVDKSTQELSEELLPKCHLVISLLKRWILGTFQGCVGAGHLQDYLNEFTFRFNRRSSRSRGKLFYRLAEQSVATQPNDRSKIINH
jgi:transposase-like protein